MHTISSNPVYYIPVLWYSVYIQVHETDICFKIIYYMNYVCCVVRGNNNVVNVGWGELDDEDSGVSEDNMSVQKQKYCHMFTNYRNWCQGMSSYDVSHKLCTLWCVMNDDDVIDIGWWESNDEYSETGGEENMSVKSNNDTCSWNMYNDIHDLLLFIIYLNHVMII